MGTSTTKDTRTADAAISWGIAVLGGILATVIFMTFIDVGITGAIFLAGLLTVAVGFFLTREMTRPLPAPGAGRIAPAPKAAPAKAPAANAPSAPAPAAARGAMPAALSAPRDGGPDDLKQIKGVGPKLQGVLHSMGYYHFEQIASWTPQEVAWVDENLEGFKGRVTRDDWVIQAKELARR